MHQALISATASPLAQIGHALPTIERITDSTLDDDNPIRLSSSTAEATAHFRSDARVGAGRTAISGATSVSAA